MVSEHRARGCVLLQPPCYGVVGEVEAVVVDMTLHEGVNFWRENSLVVPIVYPALSVELHRTYRNDACGRLCGQAF